MRRKKGLIVLGIVALLLIIGTIFFVKLQHTLEGAGGRLVRSEDNKMELIELDWNVKYLDISLALDKDANIDGTVYYDLINTEGVSVEKGELPKNGETKNISLKSINTKGQWQVIIETSEESIWVNYKMFARNFKFIKYDTEIKQK